MPHPVTAIAAAYRDGRTARRLDTRATANPHRDWQLGVAWALGWHWPVLGEDMVAQMEAAGWTHATCERWDGAETVEAVGDSASVADALEGAPRTGVGSTGPGRLRQPDEAGVTR